MDVVAVEPRHLVRVLVHPLARAIARVAPEDLAAGARLEHYWVAALLLHARHEGTCGATPCPGLEECRHVSRFEQRLVGQCDQRGADRLRQVHEPLAQRRHMASRVRLVHDDAHRQVRHHPRNFVGAMTDDDHDFSDASAEQRLHHPAHQRHAVALDERLGAPAHALRFAGSEHQRA